MQHRLSNCLVCRRSCHVSKARLGLLCTLYLLARKASRFHTVQISKACHCVAVGSFLDGCIVNEGLEGLDLIFRG